MKYEKIYNKDYFSGKTSFFWPFGYGKAFRRYFENLIQPIDKYIKNMKTGKVLDIGCAYGFMLQKFPSSFQKFGLDVSEYAINVAKKKLPGVSLKVGNVENELPFEEGFFDIILLNDVLEHLANPKIALENIWKVLKKDGILYITTPNLNNIRKTIFKYPDKKEHHISLFSHLDLILILNRFGFKILEHWTFLNLFVYLKFQSNIGIESGVICKK